MLFKYSALMIFLIPTIYICIVFISVGTLFRKVARLTA